MSHYAKIIRPLRAIHRGSGERWVLSQEAIRNVLCFDEGYTFEALMHGEPPTWHEMQTAEDLPAFTDKGSEARSRRASLVRGRPRVSAAQSEKILACKVTEEQHQYVTRCAEQLDKTVSEFVRAALIADGMPE